MQTITFYAYKGGTGRSLLVANFAKYLGRLGLKVFLIDLDLEAPGLHYKLSIGRPIEDLNIKRGAVDFISQGYNKKTLPASLKEHVVRVRMDDQGKSEIFLMPAGNTLAEDYWSNLSSIDWFELVHKKGKMAIPLLLELKARIEKEYAPDFLLIDSRTGFTELGGIATTILSDTLVCMLLYNRENIDGTKQIVRAARLAPRLSTQDPIKIHVVLSRLPRVKKSPTNLYEDHIVQEIEREFSQIETESASTRTGAPLEYVVLHSEEALQLEEELRIGGTKSVDQSTLLKDYLRLFSKLVPKTLVEPRLDSLIQETMKQMLEFPERVQNELEQLAIYCPHPSSYMALLKYYRLRQVSLEKQVSAARRYWEVSDDSKEPLLWTLLTELFGKEAGRPGLSRWMSSEAEFFESVWRKQGNHDSEIAIRLADLYVYSENEHKAAAILHQTIESHLEDPKTIAACIQRLLRMREFDTVKAIIERSQSAAGDDPAFQIAWMEYLVRSNNATAARELLEKKNLRPAMIQASAPLLYIQFLKLLGMRDEMRAALSGQLDRLLVEKNVTMELIEVGRHFNDIGQLELFSNRVRQVLGKSTSAQVLSHIREAVANRSIIKRS